MRQKESTVSWRVRSKRLWRQQRMKTSRWRTTLGWCWEHMLLTVLLERSTRSKQRMSYMMALKPRATQEDISIIWLVGRAHLKSRSRENEKTFQLRNSCQRIDRHQSRQLISQRTTGKLWLNRSCAWCWLVKIRDILVTFYSHDGGISGGSCRHSACWRNHSVWVRQIVVYIYIYICLCVVAVSET